MKRTVIILILILLLTGCESSDYKKALELEIGGRYEEAREIFISLGDYSDSKEQVKACNYELGCLLIDDEQYSEAAEIFEALGEYKNSSQYLKKANYELAMDLLEDGSYTKAQTIFAALGNYLDSPQRVEECKVLIDPIRIVCQKIREQGVYDKETQTYFIGKAYAKNEYLYLIEDHEKLKYAEITDTDVYALLEMQFECSWSYSSGCRFSLEYFNHRDSEYSVCEGTIDKRDSTLLFCEDTIHGRAMMKEQDRNHLVLNEYSKAVDYLNECVKRFGIGIDGDYILNMVK